VRIPKHARRPTAVHRPLRGVGICLFALRRQLLLAEEAVSARNLERRDVALADFDLVFVDARADLVDDAAELVAQDVALGHLYDSPVQEV